MVRREAAKPSGGLLCDEMGLGKTIQVLGVMKENKMPATLLLAPLCTLDQWQETAERCGYCVWRRHPTRPEWDLPKTFRPSAIHLFLINYECAAARPALVTRRIWDRIVFDEAHRMADSSGRTHKLASLLKAKAKWFLTATPIVNKLKDVISLFTLLGYEIMDNELEQLAPVIQETVLCRKMEDLRGVIRELPCAAKQINHVLDFTTDEEGEFYRGIQGVLQRRWRALQHDAEGGQEMFRLIMRLRQISIHPQVYISARKKEWKTYTRADWDTPSTKFEKLKSLLLSQKNVPHRWIIFCHFHEEMELLQEFLLTECPIVREVGIYNGSLSQKERAEVLETSKEPLFGSQQDVLLMQLQSGGVGLNLQHCDRIVFMGPWWTAALMDQAIGRAVRIGQTEKVEVHRLILKEEQTMNIDKKMLIAAEKKRDLCDRFLSLSRGPVSEDPEEDPIAPLVN